MAKLFTSITESGQVVAPVAAKSTLINTGSRNMFLTTTETDTALSGLSDEAKQGVKNALYGIKPGEAKSLAAGTYNLTLDWSGSAVFLVES
ncbi:hypothetical protein [Spirosoma aerolatum]|uniref:hypothetical protein n=1 Tax=Spirosoma aerolatum TaxID=1211326 RepID=UPI0009AC0088|nr:hypothetical protein [Spirosoma aerolatum]